MAHPLSSVRRTGVRKPQRLVLFGTSGIGKSSFAAAAPAPIFIQTEEGLDALDVDAFPLCRAWDDVLDCIGSLANEEHAYRTVVLDTADWCERLIWSAVAAGAGVKTIEDIGYGKGYKAAVDKWRTLLDGLDYLRDQRSMQVIVLAHSQIKRFDDPLSDPYDRYLLDLHASAASIVTEWCDVLAFANYRVSTVKADVGFGTKVTRAVGAGDRVMYTQERPGWVAKSRWRIPDTMKLDYPTYAAALAAAGAETLAEPQLAA